jgi:Domain of unknown function (DUF4351)
MNEYDTALKSFLRNSRESLPALTSLTVDRWHNVELPEVRNRRVDLPGEALDGRLIHIELQSTHDTNMALRMLEYCAAVCRQFGRFPEQIVLYVGEAPLRMTGGLRGPDISFGCRIVDIRELDGERLLQSDRIEDNVIAVLANVKDQREAVKHILSRIVAGDPAQRSRALAGILILAGLRRLAAEVIEEEASQMPILDDIIDHPVLGPKIKQAEEKARQKGMQQGPQQGMQEGREQGLEMGMERGRHDGEVAVLLRQIGKRFGSVPDTLQERFAKMSIPEVESVALRLLDARSVEELLD